MPQNPFYPEMGSGGAPPLGPAYLQCDACDCIIEENTPCVSLFVGVVGRSRKTGYAMVVASQDSYPTVAVHIECLTDYAKRETGFGEDPLFCASCSDRLEEDMGE